tara:strand:- start:26 stop:1132 length:1107 start_codon:yes stop_codon:yes gene_type:complete
MISKGLSRPDSPPPLVVEEEQVEFETVEAPVEEIIEEVVPEEPAEPIEVEFKARIGETVDDYVAWTGFSKEEILDQLLLATARDLRAGHTYVLLLTQQQLEQFNSRRLTRDQVRRDAFYKKHHITDYRNHVVAPGESAGRIAAKNNVPIWLLVEVNTGLNLARLHPGDVVEVPIVAQGARPATLGNTQPTLAVPGQDSMVQPTMVPAQVVEQAPAATPPADPVEAPTAPMPQQTPKLTVTVRNGENLGVFAAMAELSVDEIMKANHLAEANSIQIGMNLVIPIPPDAWATFLDKRRTRDLIVEAWRSYERRGYRVIKVRVQPGDIAVKLAETHGADISALTVLNPDIDLNVLVPGKRLRLAIPPAVIP